MNVNSRTLGRQLSRAALAAALLGVTAAPFGSSVEPRPVDPALGRPLPAAGAALRLRGEGWATTHYGEHGLLRVDAEAARRRGHAARVIGVWGDSFVEAGQVDDSTKFSAQLRRIAVDRGDTRLTAFAIGQPDRDVSDVIELVPRYEALMGFDEHALVLHDLFDVSPNGVTFVADPQPHFVSRSFGSPAARLRSGLSAWHLDFLWTSLHRAFLAHRNPIGGEPLRWRVGPVEQMATSWPSWRRLYEVDPSQWAYALDRLRGCTKHNWTIFYLPRVPFVEDGRIFLEHPAAPLVARFSLLCEERGIGFVDLSRELATSFVEDGRSAFGFANSRVARGHLNATGHRLLAQALYDCYRER